MAPPDDIIPTPEAAARLAQRTLYRQAELVVNVTAALPGSILDWPPYVQDTIYEALRRKTIRDSAEAGEPVIWEIVVSYMDVDVDEGPYCHVIAIARRKPN